MCLAFASGKLVGFDVAKPALVASALSATPTQAADGFEKVRCDRPVVPALSGARPDTSGPVVRTEARRRSIGLRHRGADQVAANVGTITWKICGRDFVVLSVGPVRRDAVELPAHSREAPAFSASTCEVAGRTAEGVAIGVFAVASRPGVWKLPARVAWRIDRARNRFVPLGATAPCATDGITAAGAS